MNKQLVSTTFVQGGNKPRKPGIPGNIREFQNTGNIREI